MHRTHLIGIAGAVVAAASAGAAFDLQITEIWPGNEPGANLTEDWFEITNFGDTAWIAAVDGDLWFDDESFDSTTADLLSGITTIAPGESVVFVDGEGDGLAEWLSIWTPEVDPGVQVGSYGGAGLSQGGDAIGIWVSFGAPSGDPDFTAAYPDAEANGGQSYDVFLGEFSTVGNAAGAVATDDINDLGQPAIASPGSIPAPGAVALLGLAGALGARRRR